jgi:membrane protease YdiL (CAAX protease family)
MRSNPWWLSWGLMALLPAVCEELLFRGWMLAAFVGDGRHRERLFWGILAQAACFALFHLLPERMPQTFVLGLVLGCLVTLTGSLLTAVVCHAAHNSMPILVLALAGGIDADQMPATGGLDDLPGWAIAAALVTLAVGGLFVASGRLHLSRGEAPR